MKIRSLTRDYHTSITAQVPAAEVFADICDVSAWWAKNFEGRSNRTGDRFTVRFGQTSVDFVIKESIPGKMVLWQVEDCHLHWLKDKKEWNGTEVRWEVSTVDGNTRVDMTHIGLLPEVECFKDCEKGWNHHIKDSLLDLIVKKKGMPE